MSRKASVRTRPAQLWTVRMIHEDIGLPMATAESIFRRIAIDYDALVRSPGSRRVYVTLAGYNAWRVAAGMEQL